MNCYNTLKKKRLIFESRIIKVDLLSNKKSFFIKSSDIFLSIKLYFLLRSYIKIFHSIERNFCILIH